MHTRIADRLWLGRTASALRVALVASALATLTTLAHAAEKVVFAWGPASDALPDMGALEEKAVEAQGIEGVDQRLNSPAGLVDAFIADRAEGGPYGTAPGIAMVAESQNPGSLKIFGLSG